MGQDIRALGVLLFGALILWSLAVGMLGDDRGNFRDVDPLPIDIPAGPDPQEPLPGCNWC